MNRRISRWTVVALAPLLSSVPSVGAGAQQARPSEPAAPAAAAAESLFRRAQRLVGEGEPDAGRALVDSAMAAAPAGSMQYAEALFWHASLAATAAEAERDYRRLIVEFPLSPRSEEALMRLAQMENARGDRALALQHLDRLLLEHPASAQRARASYWKGRFLLEGGDVARACAAFAAARADAAPSDVELRNQLDYYGQPCAGLAAAPTPADSVSPRPGAPESAASRLTPRAAVTSTGAVAPSAPARKAGRGAGGGGGAYTIQVAAYGARAPAEQLRRKLAARGYDARVTQAGAVYRVRVGRFRTRSEAAAVAQAMAAKQLTAIVVEAEPR